MRAYHQRSLFRPSAVEDVNSDIRNWEQSHQEDLKKLAVLIRKMRKMVKTCGGKTVARYDSGADKLIIWKGDGIRLLPDELYCQWENDETLKPAVVENISTNETAVKDLY